MPREKRSVQHASLLEALGEALRIRFMFERQTAQMLFERIFRIDLYQFLPHAAGFLGLTKMAESGRKQRTGEIRVGHKPDALAQRRCGGLIPAGEEVRRAEEVQELLG